ncbi:DUF3822 family protein [Bacteroidetes bacterium endosymbiont of Geopemphigus sp.]|uniref:DUF3822 family protein n=1 Tax=Bacteroidetes bacterium endosymbiont of Geopemphigus sp. TaxID=2047937 RepID=UPI000CD312B1
MVIFKGKKLLLYNDFIYHTPEEILYYVLFAAERWSLSLHKLPGYTLVDIFALTMPFSNC